MSIVKDYYIEHTHVRIHDDCCVKTKEEVDIILMNIGSIYADYLAQKAFEEMKNDE